MNFLMIEKERDGGYFLVRERGGLLLFGVFLAVGEEERIRCSALCNSSIFIFAASSFSQPPSSSSQPSIFIIAALHLHHRSPPSSSSQIAASLLRSEPPSPEDSPLPRFECLDLIFEIQIVGAI